MMQTASLLVAHGSRVPRTAAAVDCFAADVADGLNHPLGVGYLELCPPTIHQELDRLYADGARHIAVQPLMLTRASHTVSDIPALLAEWQHAHPDVSLLYGDAFGSDHVIEQVARARLNQMGEGHLLLVGRGAKDPAANQLAYDLAAKLARGRPHAVGFAGTARPTVEQALNSLPDGPVVILPYLLFEGRLFDSLQALASDRCMLAPPLAPDRMLVDDVVQRLRDLHKDQSGGGV